MINFNPRSRKGSDVYDFGDITYNREISIHAPARGATAFEDLNLEKYRISIHAPARGATINMDDKYVTRQISIHAPARGATPIY